MNEQEIIDYFELIAQQLNDIGDDPSQTKRRFAIWEFADTEIRSRLDLKTGPCLLIAREKVNYNKLSSGNSMAFNQVSFYVLIHCKPEDYTAYNAAYTNNEIIAKKIMARLIKDRSEGHPVAKGFSDDMIMHKVAGIFDNAYGWEVELMLRDRINCKLVYDPTDWTV